MDKRRKTNSLRRSTRSAATYKSSSVISANSVKASSFSSAGGNGNDYCVKWNLQSTHILNELAKIYYYHDDNHDEERDQRTDVTLFSSEGDCVQAHKIVLMLCSPYFQKIFQKVGKAVQREREGSASIVVLGNVKTADLLNLLRFIYTGEIHVSSNQQLEEFKEIAKLFGIEGVSSSKNVAGATAFSSARRRPRGRPQASSAAVKIRVLESSLTRRNYSDGEEESLQSSEDNGGGEPPRISCSESTTPFPNAEKGKNQKEYENAENASHELETVACKIEPSDDTFEECEEKEYNDLDDAGSNFSDEIRDPNNLLLEGDEEAEDDDDEDDKRKNPNNVSFSVGQSNVSINKPLSKSAQRMEAETNVNLNWRTGKLRGFVKIDPLSEETLKRDWRKKGSLQCINTVSKIYYCAYGKNSCPAALKIKTLADGTDLYFRNAYEHANHRGPYGLTSEQKAFVMQCLETGVTQPSNILYKFENSGIAKPEKLKLRNMLARLRKRVGGKYWTKKEPKWPRRIRKKQIKDEPPKKRGRPSKQEMMAASSKTPTESAVSTTTTSDQHQQLHSLSEVPPVTALGGDSKTDLTTVSSPSPQSSFTSLQQPHPNHYLGQMPFPLNPTVHRAATHHPYYHPLDNNFR